MKKYLFRIVAVTELYWRLSRSQQRPPAEQRKILRSLLRVCPYWKRGHALLGIAAVDSLAEADKRTAQRLIATIDLSAKALRELGISSAEERIAAALLESAVCFARRDYPLALQQSEQLLAEDQAQMQPSIRRRLFEQAAAAALALGMNEKAKRYLEAIPEKLRSGESEAALRYIDKREKGEL